MRLSVVIPVLDEAEGIQASLAALDPLRADGHELIVADGGSRDDTLERIGDLADKVLRCPRGRARQMNRGARAAEGEGLIFLHADTRLPADAGQLVTRSLERREWGRFDVVLTGTRRIFRVVEWAISTRSRLSGIATGDQAIFVRRAVFDGVGGFPDIPLMEDVALSRRLKARSRPDCLRARVRTSARRWESNGVARTIVLMWCLRAAFAIGVAPRRLARWYRANGAS